MIKIQQLQVIKQKCFDKIYKESNSKQTMSVSFEPIGANLVTVVMSNGIDYARLIVRTPQLHSLPAIQIAWQEFCKVCELFDPNTSITYTTDVSTNSIIIKDTNSKTKLRTVFYFTDTNKTCNFKFDFNDPNLQLVSTDNATVLKKAKGSLYDSICLWQNYIMSTDGSFGVINTTQYSFGDTPQLLIEKLPQGKWYYSPTQRLIVSEDKNISMTIKRSTNNFPNKALLQVSASPLPYSIIADVKELSVILAKCSMVGEFVVFTVVGSDTINIKTLEYETELKISTNAPDGFSIKLNIGYLKNALMCCEDKECTLFISDKKDYPMIRLELKDKKIFGMGVKQ